MDWLRELDSFRPHTSRGDDAVRNVRRKVTEPLSETPLNAKFFLDQIAMPHLAPTWAPTCLLDQRVPIYAAETQEQSSVAASGLGPERERSGHYAKSEARLQKHYLEVW